MFHISATSKKSNFSQKQEKPRKNKDIISNLRSKQVQKKNHQKNTMQDKNFSQTFITFHKSKQNPPTLHLNTLISNFKKIPFFFSHSKNKQNKTPSSTTSSKGYTTKRYTTLQQPFS